MPKKMMPKIERYEELKQIGPDIYCLDGAWQETLFRRRMTVVRLRSGGTFIHSAIQLEEADYAKLERIGVPEVIVAPNTFHGSEAHVYKRRYPKAKLLVAQPARKSISKLCPVDGVLPEWDPSWSPDLECMEIEGTRLLHESVFFHPKSRTLILTDLAFNMQVDFQGFEAKVARWNRIDKRFGPSRICKLVFVKDKRRFAEGVRRMLGWDFDRVVVNHGEILESGGQQAVRAGFGEMGLL